MPHQLSGRVNTHLDLDETRANFRDQKIHVETLGTYMRPIENFRDL